MIQTKFLDLYLAKFLNTLAKPFFPYKHCRILLVYYNDSDELLNS